MRKKDLLEKLHNKWEGKDLPLREGAHHMVWGQGNLDAKIYMLGEAPGRFEDLQGKPFVGQAGKLLDKLLEEINLKREEIFISNLIRFRPPQNRDPELNEIAAFEESVDEEIKIVDPEIIVTVGRIPLNKFLPGVKISQIHGKAQTINFFGKKILLFPMYHPAAALRRLEVKSIMQKDFRTLAKLLQD